MSYNVSNESTIYPKISTDMISYVFSGSVKIRDKNLKNRTELDRKKCNFCNNLDSICSKMKYSMDCLGVITLHNHTKYIYCDYSVNGQEYIVINPFTE